MRLLRRRGDSIDSTRILTVPLVVGGLSTELASRPPSCATVPVRDVGRAPPPLRDQAPHSGYRTFRADRRGSRSLARQVTRG